MEVLRLVPEQSLGISLTKGTIPLKDNTSPSTPAVLLLFPGQEGSPLLLQTVSHLVFFDVCKHRRKSLDKRVFLSKRTPEYSSRLLKKASSRKIAPRSEAIEVLSTLDDPFEEEF
ncbi:hypothetical protein Taro_018563 [Colocasia esculenta]|uniref:Uncharacterized protein n=1 Tax=Colocasia esculenta TaxID=4460 RepID=A0A843URQ3_COLES|nr:hypothetical protein [Colocasia esculenta]